MKLVQRFWPLFIIIGLWLVFSSPYIFHNLVPYPSKYQVSFFPPWSSYQQYWGPVKNNAMPDVIDQIYPWKHFTIEWLQKGMIPSWNPNNFAGNPHIANFQSAVFSPFNLLYFMLPFLDAWSVIVLLQPLLAGIFMYMFLKELAVSRLGAVVGSIAFMFCGFMVTWMAYATLSMAVAFLPLALWGIERGFTKNPWYFTVMTLAIVISFFSGHFQTSFYVVLYIAAYIFFRSFKQKRRMHLVWALGCYFLGFLISLPQLFPTIIFYQNSVRSSLAYEGGGIPFDYIITALSPDFYGNPVTRNDWRGNYAEWASFVGVIPFLFALLSVRPSKKPLRYFFIAAAVICLLLAMETPLHNLLIATHLPIIATSIPSRLIVLFSFSVAVLSGIGVTDFQLWKKKERLKQIVPAGIILGAVFVIIGLSVTVLHVLPADKSSLAIKNLVLPFILFSAASGVLLVTSFIVNKKIIAACYVVLLLLVGFDSYRFAAKWMPFEEKSLVYPNVPVISAMQRRIEYGRVYGNLGTQVESYYNLPSLEGYDPLYVQRYGEFIQSAKHGSFEPAERSVVHLDRRGKYTDRVLDLLGVTLLFHPLGDTGQEWAYPVWEDADKYSVVYQDDKFQLYRNNTAMPRAALFYRTEVVADNKTLLHRFYSDGFDFRNILLLEENTEIGQQRKFATGSAKIVSYTPNVVSINTMTSHPAMLFLSDTYYPGWTVTVNGKPEKIYRADYAFRAVKVPQGESNVVFAYSPY